jgi:hypothetical protein
MDRFDYLEWEYDKEYKSKIDLINKSVENIRKEIKKVTDLVESELIESEYEDIKFKKLFDELTRIDLQDCYWNPSTGRCL